LTQSNLRERLRNALLSDIWRSLALVLGAVQVQILHWALVVARGEGLGVGTMLLLSLAAMFGNVLLMPLIRVAGRAKGVRRLAARGYMNLGIATLLMGLSVLVSWLFVWPVALGAGWLLDAQTLASDGFRLTSGTLVSSVALMFVWGVSGGQAFFAHTRVVVELPGLDESRRGLEIVQLTDLHIGNGLEGDRLSALVEKVNALEPDLIAITGDIFDFDPAFVPDGAKRLSELRARLGVYAVLGNHDTYTGSELVADELGQYAPGVRLLREEIVALPGDSPLYIAGVDDPGRDWTARDVQIASLERLARSVPSDGPTILLVHRPEVFHQAARLGFPLTLAGHTHGGQISLPLPGGRINPARIVSAFTRGLYRQGDSVLYVNRGVGMAGPRIRFNCRREIATVELA
jgi:predicted MPP superfamily phosphohydrolase